MTWNQLLAAITEMPPEHRRQEVRFVEPYDKQREGCELDLFYAEEDLTIGGGEKGWDEPETIFVKKGEPCLR